MQKVSSRARAGVVRRTYLLAAIEGLAGTSVRRRRVLRRFPQCAPSLFLHLPLRNTAALLFPVPLERILSARQTNVFSLPFDSDVGSFVFDGTGFTPR